MEISERTDEEESLIGDAAFMNLARIMTHDVVSVTPGTSLKEVARILVERRIAGVPVCDAGGRVLGIVSEGDILWKETGLSDHPDGLIARVLNLADGDDKRIGALSAGEAMTSPAIVAGPDTSVAQAAKLMIDHRVNRLPVVLDGKLVGIVARSDLVRAFLRTDEAIEQEIAEDVLLHTLWIDPDTLEVKVEEGSVTVYGKVDNRSTAELIETYIRRIPGVVNVTAKLKWSVDDLSRRTAFSASHLPTRL